MAAPKGVGAVEAYKNTKSRVGPRGVDVKDFVPKASPAVEDQAARLAFQTVKDLRAASAYTPAKSGEVPGLSSPAGGPTGGRKSRRRRRGGALTKPLPELLEDLVRNPSKATLENVLSDLKTSRILRLEAHGERLDGILRQPLRAGEDIETRVRTITRELIGILRVYLHGGRRKTTRRRK